MYTLFQRHVKKLSLSTKPILLAVSGGVDSIVLMHLFQRAAIKFEVAHVHFGLRGKEADGDQAFVKAEAQRLGARFHSRQFDTQAYAKAHKISLQMAARQLRYTWFHKLLKERRLQQVATAHHLNDSLETFIRHTAKGSGLKGLLGIPIARDAIIRPLFWATKAEILAYAQKEKLLWRKDASNAAQIYERNYIRHTLVPHLKTLNPSIEESFRRTQIKLAQTFQLCEDFATILKQSYWKEQKEGVVIEVEPLLEKGYATLLLHQWLSPFGFGFVPLQRWVTAPPQKGKRLESLTHILLAESHTWWLLPKKKFFAPQKQYSLRANSRPITYQGGWLRPSFFSRKKLLHLPSSSHVGTFDREKLLFPLVVRPWQHGDVFYPFGMQGHRQKLSDFLKAHKIPHHQRKSVYVVTSEGNIVWVVGHRVDQRFALTPTTKKVYQLLLDLT